MKVVSALASPIPPDAYFLLWEYILHQLAGTYFRGTDGELFSCVQPQLRFPPALVLLTAEQQQMVWCSPAQPALSFSEHQNRRMG